MLVFVLALLLGLSGASAGHAGSVHTFSTTGGGPGGSPCGTGPC